MKIAKRLLLISTSILIIIVSTVHATAFITEEVDAETAERVCSNTKISVTQQMPDTREIDCFDVNENGWIALGFARLGEATICIYNEAFEFKYAYTFEQSGNYGLQWAGSNIYLYTVRGDLQIEVDPAGKIVDVKSISITEENRKYWDTVVYSTKREINGRTYEISKDIGILSFFSNAYSQLNVTDSDGNRICLYNVSRSLYATTLFRIGMVVIFLGLCAFMAVKLIRSKAREK